jgi:hypothetical protein
MKLPEVLQRYPTGGPHAGRNLLAGQRLTGVAYAQMVVTQKLNDDFPGVPLDITWRLPWNFCGAVTAWPITRAAAIAMSR